MIFILKFLNSSVLQVLILFGTHHQTHHTAVTSEWHSLARSFTLSTPRSACIMKFLVSCFSWSLDASWRFPDDPCESLCPGQQLGLSWTDGFCAFLRKSSKRIFAKLSHLKLSSFCPCNWLADCWILVWNHFLIWRYCSLLSRIFNVFINIICPLTHHTDLVYLKVHCSLCS